MQRTCSLPTSRERQAPAAHQNRSRSTVCSSRQSSLHITASRPRRVINLRARDRRATAPRSATPRQSYSPDAEDSSLPRRRRMPCAHCIHTHEFSLDLVVALASPTTGWDALIAVHPVSLRPRCYVNLPTHSPFPQRPFSPHVLCGKRSLELEHVSWFTSTVLLTRMRPCPTS